MKFSGIRTNAGNGPKYMRTLPFTIIASELIAPKSTPTSPRRKCSACESYASPSHSLTNTWLPPLVAIIQISTLSANVSGRSFGVPPLPFISVKNCRKINGADVNPFPVASRHRYGRHGRKYRRLQLRGLRSLQVKMATLSDGLYSHLL